MPQRSRRFPASVFGVGEEPDARFTLANERTFLAWISVGLAVLSVGVGLDKLATGVHPGFLRAAALLLIAAGVACAVQAWVGWIRVERALRTGRPLPGPVLAPWLAAALAVAAALVGVGVLVA